MTAKPEQSHEIVTARTARVRREWDDFLEAGPEGAPPDDPFWLLVAVVKKNTDELFARVTRETDAEFYQRRGNPKP